MNAHTARRFNTCPPSNPSSRHVRRRTCYLLATISAYVDAIDSRDFAQLRELLNEYLKQPMHLRMWAESLSAEELNAQF
jgi:hypothetical protein